MIRKARLRLQAGLLFPAPCRERGKGRDISFSKRDIPPFHPPRENFHCKRAARRAAMLADCTAHSAAEPRLKLLYDLPLLLLPAVAQPSAALLPYGCGTPLAAAALPILQKCAVIIVYQSTPQCGERSNAAFGKQSAAGQTSLAPHDSKARLISVTTCRRFMAKPCTPHPHCAARAALQAANPQWRGQGAAPLAFSWGSKGDILSRERISPLSASPHGVGKSRSLFGLLPLRAMRGKREDFSFEKPSLFTYFLLCRSNYSASCIAFAAATAFACASAEHCS